ncbi:MAG TPA: chemotaxis response regulator protein-glutamate methylesterase, partial [Spirochaetota bacterium]|nr:chemotaxis response regulator protein-glutamate methylesterase [Spirochaetota bacterium]
MSQKIKVMVVDDSALVRKVITDILESDKDIEVIGTANNGKSAVFKNLTLNPDVITMDIEMPIMDGLEALQEIIKTNPKPVIMMSVLTQYGAEATFRALEFGAIDFIPKPSNFLAMSMDDIAELLISKVKAVAHIPLKISYNKDRTNRQLTKLTVDSNQKRVQKIVGIGTSTGGPSALQRVLQKLPGNFPSPILVVQHMPPGFTKAFAERLDSLCYVSVKEAEDSEEAVDGCVYIAPGDSHIVMEKMNNKRIIRLSQSDKVSGHRPSADVLFQSMVKADLENNIGVIMTGMGRDGAMGIKEIHN